MNRPTPKQILSGYEGPGVNQYMLEEVYFSDVCIDEPSSGTDEKKEFHLNPQNARYVNGKYYFDYPALWYESVCNNKAIGLRRIDCFAKSLDMHFTAYVKRKAATGTEEDPRKLNVIVTAGRNDSIDKILSTICAQLNSHFRNSDTWNTDPKDYPEFHYNYDIDTQKARIWLEPVLGSKTAKKWAFYLEKYNDDFANAFNIEIGDKTYPEEPAEPTTRLNGTTELVFKAWSRQDAFLHASFVSGTSFNYLGRSGEFYTKPSKMYPWHGNTREFWLEVSSDGKKPRAIPHLKFIVELCYIYNDRHYKAQ